MRLTLPGYSSSGQTFGMVNLTVDVVGKLLGRLPTFFGFCLGKISPFPPPPARVSAPANEDMLF